MPEEAVQQTCYEDRRIERRTAMTVAHLISPEEERALRQLMAQWPIEQKDRIAGTLPAGLFEERREPRQPGVEQCKAVEDQKPVPADEPCKAVDPHETGCGRGHRWRIP